MTGAPIKTLDFSLSGDVSADDFLPWIKKHAAKLSVSFAVTAHDQHRLAIKASGSQAMLDAFALACSLGPKSVCIDTLTLGDVIPPRADDDNPGIRRNIAQP